MSWQELMRKVRERERRRPDSIPPSEIKAAILRLHGERQISEKLTEGLIDILGLKEE